MKKFLYLLVLGLTLCTTATAKKVGVYCFFADNGEQVYEDENVQLLVGKIDDSRVGVVVINKTDKVLYIDKANSFLYYNGETKTYFQNAAYSSGTVNSSGASMNMGALASGMGIGGGVGRALSGLTVGGGTSVNNTTTIFEQRVIGIAPKTAQVLTEMQLSSSLSTKQIIPGSKLNKGRFVNPKEKFTLGAVRRYTSLNSPLSIKATIKYCLNENFQDDESVMATAGNFVEGIVIDNHKGLKRSDVALPYCAPYAGKSCYGFRSNTSYSGYVWTFVGIEVGVCALVGVIVLAALSGS